MAKMQDKAIEIINRLPDDKIEYVVSILENIEKLTVQEEPETDDSSMAYDELQKYRRKEAAVKRRV